MPKMQSIPASTTPQRNLSQVNNKPHKTELPSDYASPCWAVFESHTHPGLTRGPPGGNSTQKSIAAYSVHDCQMASLILHQHRIKGLLITVQRQLESYQNHIKLINQSLLSLHVLLPAPAPRQPPGGSAPSPPDLLPQSSGAIALHCMRGHEID